MKKRNIAAVVILHIITLGIYFFYWAYATRKELAARHDSPKNIPAFGWLVLPYIALLPAFIAMFTLPAEGSDIGAEALFAALWVAVGVYFLIMIVACIAVFYWWFYRYTKVASTVTNGMEFAPSYILFILATLMGVAVVWQALIQRDINRLADTNTSQPKTDSKG